MFSSLSTTADSELRTKTHHLTFATFPLQEAQWPKHMLTCANQQTGGGQPAAEEPGEPQQPEQQLQEQLQPVQQQLEA